MYAGLIILFRLLSFICEKRNIAEYDKLEESAKLVYVTHWAFFLVFVATAVPYSFVMVRVLFAPNGMMDLVEKSTFRSLTFPLAFQLCMYVYEVSLQHATYVQAIKSKCHCNDCMCECDCSDTPGSVWYNNVEGVPGMVMGQGVTCQLERMAISADTTAYVSMMQCSVANAQPWQEFTLVNNVVTLPMLCRVLSEQSCG